MAQVANSTPATGGAITAQWPLIRWTTAPSGTPPNTIVQTAVSTGARGSAIFTSSNSSKCRHLGVMMKSAYPGLALGHFDGDDEFGVAAMSSKNFLLGAPLP